MLRARVYTENYIGVRVYETDRRPIVSVPSRDRSMIVHDCKTVTEWELYYDRYCRLKLVVEVVEPKLNTSWSFHTLAGFNAH